MLHSLSVRSNISRFAGGALLLAAGCIAVAGPVDSLPQRCAGAACGKVATAVAWPEVRLDEGTVPFNVHNAFSIRLPKGPTDWVLHADNGVTARYTDGRWIGVQVMHAAAAKASKSAALNGPDALAYADLPRILYTKTPADREPSGLHDRQLWRLALVHKNSLLDKATQVHAAQRGPLTAYFADAGVAGTTGDIRVVHQKVKDSYLFVQVKGFAFDDVQRIIGSIETKRE